MVRNEREGRVGVHFTPYAVVVNVAFQVVDVAGATYESFPQSCVDSTKDIFINGVTYILPLRLSCKAFNMVKANSNMLIIRYSSFTLV
jgi:hypothetical protein